MKEETQSNRRKRAQRNTSLGHSRKKAAESPETTSEPDAPARIRAGHPKAVHKVPKTSVGTPETSTPPEAQKILSAKYGRPRSVRKRPKKRFPRTEGMPITHQRKGAFRTIFTPTKHPRKKKNAVRKQAQIHQKSGGSIQKEQHKTAKTICGGVILFLYIRRSKNPLNLYIKYFL